MTSLTSQDGKLVVRDGKLGTEQACCCGEGNETGVCCTCLDTGNNIIGNGNTFEIEEDAAQLASENNDLLQTILSFMQNNGHTCITFDESFYFQNEDGNWQVDVARATGRCCGTLDEDIEIYPFIYACIPDETSNRTCVDGLTAAECNEQCGDFYANESCQNFDCSNPLP